MPPPADPSQRIAWAVAQLQGVKDRLTKREADINALRSRMGLLDARVGELEEERADRPTVPGEPPASLEKRIAALEETAEKVRAGDSALRGILDQQRKATESRNDRVDAVLEKLKAFEETLEGFGVVQGEMRDRQEQLEEALARKDEQIAALRRELEEARARPAAASPARRAEPAKGKAAEPKAAEPKAAEPKAEPAKTPSREDDLKQIKGIGPKFEKKLKEIGVRTFDQIAAWSDDDVDEVASRVGMRAQRIRRDGWIDHARELASSR